MSHRSRSSRGERGRSPPRTSSKRTKSSPATMEMVRSLASWIGSKPSCSPLPVKPGLCFLVGLISEVPVDPLNHRHRGSRHSGDKEHVHTCHEHPNPAQPRSNPVRPQFPQRRFFGTPTSPNFFETPWESRKGTHKQECNNGGLNPPPRGNPFFIKRPGIVGTETLKQPRSRRHVSTLGDLAGW